MILPLIILYVVTLVYLAITERFRNFASLIGLQGWLLFAVALVRLHAINPAELAFICLETLLFKGILVPGLLFAVIRRTKINRVSRSGSTQSGSLLLSLVALAVSASVTYYIADTTIDLVFFGVAFYSLLSGLILDRHGAAGSSPTWSAFWSSKTACSSFRRLSASRCRC